MNHYRLADNTISTERSVGAPWIAFLNDDRRLWEAGRTEAEAIGKLVITHYFNKGH